MKMKVIVTGGAGFIGSHLVDALIERGDEVLVIDNLSHLAGGKRENINPGALFLEKDITNDVELIDAFKKMEVLNNFRKVDYVFHCAALPRIQLSLKMPVITEKVNVTGTLHIIALAVWLGAKKLIYSSSSSIYGNQPTMPLREDMPINPLSPYALQKFAGERYCQILYASAKPNRFNGVVCLRYFNVYGLRQSDEGDYAAVIGTFLKNNKNNKRGITSIIYGGDQTRDFTWVGDVVRANILAAESDKVGNGEVINIGSGENHSINQLARMIGGSYDRAPARSGESLHTLAGISKAKDLLDWEPKISLKEGIAELRNKKLYGLT